jgi:asparagine synthase (glutamine-hydrolysing)
VFNGEGGDPLFGGPKNLPMLLHHWYGVVRQPRFRERHYLASYQRSYEIVADLLSPELKAQIDPGRDREDLLTPFFERHRPRLFLNKLMAINLRFKAARLILPKVDRMFAAAHVVPQSPLFDERLIRLSFAMPRALKLSARIEKVILKLVYADALPRSVIERPKGGMRVPVHYWFQGELKRYARKILSRRNLERAGIFNPDRVRDLLRYDCEGGPGRYGLRLWMILTFEIWRRIVPEGER